MDSTCMAFNGKLSLMENQTTWLGSQSNRVGLSRSKRLRILCISVSRINLLRLVMVYLSQYLCSARISLSLSMILTRWLLRALDTLLFPTVGMVLSEEQPQSHTRMHNVAPCVVGKCSVFYGFFYIYLCLLPLHIGGDIECRLSTQSVAIAYVRSGV